MAVRDRREDLGGELLGKQCGPLGLTTVNRLKYKNPDQSASRLPDQPGA